MYAATAVNCVVSMEHFHVGILYVYTVRMVAVLHPPLAAKPTCLLYIRRCVFQSETTAVHEELLNEWWWWCDVWFADDDDEMSLCKNRVYIYIKTQYQTNSWEGEGNSWSEVAEIQLNSGPRQIIQILALSHFTTSTACAEQTLFRVLMAGSYHTTLSVLTAHLTQASSPAQHLSIHLMLSKSLLIRTNCN